MTLIRGALTRLTVFALLWWLLTEGAGQWSYGIPIVLTLTAATLALNPPAESARRPLPVRARALIGVIGWFVAHSVTGGLDVARRALRRRVDVAPVDTTVPVRLQSPVGRVLLADLAALTPGSLTVDLSADRLYLHVLHHEIDVAAQLSSLQDHLINLLDPPETYSEEHQ